MANQYSYSWIFYSKLLLLQRILISISSECTAQDTAILDFLRCSLSVCSCALGICTFKARGLWELPVFLITATLWNCPFGMKNLRWRSHMISQEVPEAIASLEMWFWTQSSVESSHIPPAEHLQFCAWGKQCKNPNSPSGRRDPACAYLVPTQVDSGFGYWAGYFFFILQFLYVHREQLAKFETKGFRQRRNMCNELFGASYSMGEFWRQIKAYY